MITRVFGATALVFLLGACGSAGTEDEDPPADTMVVRTAAPAPAAPADTVAALDTAAVHEHAHDSVPAEKPPAPAKRQQSRPAAPIIGKDSVIKPRGVVDDSGKVMPIDTL